jgi:cytochrome b561
MAALLLVAIAVLGVLVAREFRREQDYSDRVYTRLTRLHDSTGAASKALIALQNAVISEQNYPVPLCWSFWSYEPGERPV